MDKDKNLDVGALLFIMVVAPGEDVAAVAVEVEVAVKLAVNRKHMKKKHPLNKRLSAVNGLVAEVSAVFTSPQDLVVERRENHRQPRNERNP